MSNNSASKLKGRDLLSIMDLKSEEIYQLFSLARTIEEKRKRGIPFRPLDGKSIAMIFEKPSLRTRVSFEIGMFELGGYAVHLDNNDIGLGKREAIVDVAKVLSRYVDGIVIRTFEHSTVLKLAEYASIPVINALSDLEHPCQALADFYTIYEKKGDLTKLKLAFIGDGFNICHSLLLLATKLGTDIVIAAPPGYGPEEDICSLARKNVESSGSTIEITNDPRRAVKDADLIYTDVWTSMGQEGERERRRGIFQNYQINQELIRLAKEHAIIMHDLPAHRGEEITDEVIDGPQSVVFDEAENRLHIQKAILISLLS